jgi:hypothetical protein
LLLSAKVWRGENFLHADYLDALLGCLLDKAQVLFDVQSFDIFDWQISPRSI